jgi:site-specific DNA-methyltransferase (adenine-specific)
MCNEYSGRKGLCFLWITVPLLPDGFKVLEAWGYKYKTMITWKKVMSLGMGFWWRGQTEHLLFGVKGKIKAFRMQEKNIIQVKVGKHSEKPEEFRQLIERATPHLVRKIELFATEKHEGWHSWGNKVENDVEINLGNEGHKN